VDAALIHRARFLTWPADRAGARGAQGEYERPPVVPDRGPWIDARIMRTRGSQSKRRRAQEATEANVTVPYEVLLAPEVTVGGVTQAVTLTASAILETDCPVLGNPTLELAGEPEPLNDGEGLIGWYGQASIAKDVA
jgi:hypothetical protein